MQMRTIRAYQQAHYGQNESPTSKTDCQALHLNYLVKKLRPLDICPGEPSVFLH